MKVEVVYYRCWDEDMGCWDDRRLGGVEWERIGDCWCENKGNVRKRGC